MNNFFNAAAQSATPHFATFLHMQDTDARPVGLEDHPLKVAMGLCYRSSKFSLQ
jgi:hypothetical protein